MVGLGFGFRALARRLVRSVPGSAGSSRPVTGYTATMAVGLAAHALLREGRSRLHQPGDGSGGLDLQALTTRASTSDQTSLLRGHPRRDPAAGPADRRAKSGPAQASAGRPANCGWSSAFPDTYEIGISNQAIQILYHLARGREGVGVERAYLPWVDAIDEMRRRGVPLLTLETWTPGGQADLLGITLQHEFNYTNVLEMLDLAGMPLRAAERGEDASAGARRAGPACANFLPMSRFCRRGGRRRRRGGLPGDPRGAGARRSARALPRAEAEAPARAGSTACSCPA